jgi:tetratricopeptide (TPR) repeat protein
LGNLDAAQELYDLAATVAAKEADVWLSVRVLLGLGVLGQARGNYPAACDHFARAVDLSYEHEDLLLAARIGLVSVSLTQGKLVEAAQTASTVVQSASGRREENAVEVLAMVVDVGLEVGHFELALRACEAGLARELPSRRRLYFQRGLMISASMLGRDELALRSAFRTEQLISTTTNRWEHAFTQLVVGRVLDKYQDDDAGRRYIANALLEAREHGFHEVSWKAEASLDALLRRRRDERERLSLASDASSLSGVTHGLLNAVDSMDAVTA